MDWGNLILALAGILFGGGALVQGIEFFVKRCDEKKERKEEKQRVFYRSIHKKLCEYYSALDNLRLNSYKDIHKSVGLNAKTKETVTEIDKLDKTIMSRKRKCDKQGPPNKAMCDRCYADRQRLQQLYDESQTLLNESNNNLDIVNNYWTINYEQAFSLFTLYSNLENLILENKDCDIKVAGCIRVIDKGTRSLCHDLSINSKSRHDFEDELIKQISTIYVCLRLISEHLTL